MSRPGGGPELSELLGLGVSIAAILLVCLGLGWLVDTMLDSLPVFVLVGLAVGIAAAGAYVYVQFRKFMKE